MKRLIMTLGILALLILGYPVALRIQANTVEENRLQAETAIQRALNLCYAQEGFYPANLEYLIEHYGVLIDTKLYFVYYKTFGSNIRPDVEVFRIGDSDE